jgi:hypothetical protein
VNDGPELRADALTTHEVGFALRVGSPWMRSLPLSCVLELDLTMDEIPLPPGDLRVAVAGRELAVADLAAGAGGVWWFMQDRLVVHGARPFTTGSTHDVSVRIRLMLPYLHAGPDTPAVLPFHFGARLVADAPASWPTVSRDVR